jgi:serine/threonine protein kinase
VLTGYVPYSALNRVELIITVLVSEMAPAIEGSLPDSIKNLLRGCFSLEPKQRSDMAAICKVILKMTLSKFKAGGFKAGG